MVSFGVLGPLTAVNEDGPVDLKGPRLRAVLARLLVARGRVVPVPMLVDDLWESAPEGAVGAVQTFVGALRKALEPGRPPRTPSRLLVTEATGYALRTDQVDAVRFADAVATAATRPPGEARDLLDEALGWWRGPAYAEFADEAWARGEAVRLTELRLLAVERRAEAALATGRAADEVPGLEAHVEAHPLREDGWRLLALAQYRLGRQGDALATLRRARARLRDELGADPGERLARLEADVLAHAPHLSGRPTAAVFVGRASELAALSSAAGTVEATGRPVLALVSGEAGAGKTALVSALAARLSAAGWTTEWAVSPELPGTPGNWPWPRAAEGADPVADRFRRHQAVLAHLATIAPALVVLDDLQWADEDTLALLTTLTTGPGTTLVVGTYRPAEVSAGLAAALARAARAEPVRVDLGGLSPAEVAELLAGRGPAREIHERSGGNPFFVRELARLWAEEGSLRGVPAGVRDVIRHRLATLAEPARTHLRQAAVSGTDVAVLAAVAGGEVGEVGEVGDVLDSVETAVAAGFLIERDTLRFAHDLVREALYEDISRVRRVRWHAATAGVLEKLRPDDVAAIAHHLLRAEGQVPAARVAHFTRAAAELAESRFAPHEAVRLWQATVTALVDDDAARLSAEMGLVRSLAVSGDLAAARRHRAAAATAAESLGDPVLTARVLGAFDVPANWTTNDDEDLSAGLVAAAERTLVALPPGHDADRARLLVTIATERRADPGPRALAAAREAESIARRLDDPTLLAWALNGRYLQMCHRAGLARERAEIGTALLDLDVTVPFTVLGHLILVQSGAALADLPSADHHAAAADALATRYDLPLVGVFTDWYRALRLAITGDHAAARPAYEAAAVRLADAGMPGVSNGLLPLALLSVGAAPADADWGPYEPWVHPVPPVPESPPDLLLEVRLCLHASGTRDPETAARVYEALLPAAGELAAGSGLVTLGPVAEYLAGLAETLDLRTEAATHRATAAALTRRVVSECENGY